jgi:hypothetical protein
VQKKLIFDDRNTAMETKSKASMLKEEKDNENKCEKWYQNVWTERKNIIPGYRIIRSKHRNYLSPGSYDFLKQYKQAVQQLDG